MELTRDGNPPGMKCKDRLLTREVSKKQDMLFNAGLTILPCSCSLFSPNKQSITSTRSHTKGAHGETDCIAGVVIWTILRQEGERGHDPARVPKADHPRRSYAALRMALQVHHVPADDIAADAEGTHRCEAQSGVFGREVRGAVDGHQHVETGNEHREAEEDEGRTHPKLIRGVSHGDGKAEASGEGGHRVQLGLDGAVAETLDDRGDKVHDRISGNQDRCVDSLVFCCLHGIELTDA